MNGSKCQTISRLALVALVATALTSSLAAGSAQAAPECPANPSTITACGCEITTSGGNYTIAKSLIASLNSICVDIKAPNTVLEIINASTVSGGARTGTGVLVEKGADYSVVAGIRRNGSASPAPVPPPGPTPPGSGDEANITNFHTAIEVDADNVMVEFFDHLDNNDIGVLLEGGSNETVGGMCADKNQVAGLVLNGATQSRIYNFTAEQNLVAGALLNNANNNSIYNFTAILNTNVTATEGNGVVLQDSNSNSVTTGSSQSNAQNGVLVGCDTAIADPYACDGNSNSNHVTTIAAGQITGVFAGDNCETTLTVRQPKQQNGIHVEAGDSSNVLAANIANSPVNNAKFNLLDDNTNPDCDSNTWTNNIYSRLTLVSPACTARQ
jgi:hypothetical protein